MKNIMVAVILATGLVLSAGFTLRSEAGDMMGGQKGGMEPGQMMTHDMTGNMTGVMNHMNDMMERLSHPMHHMTVADHTQMYKMGKVMHRMAAEMNEMASHMEKGAMDQATVKKMHERMESIRHSIEGLQKESK